jgi:glyoxylase-like metal-dependent hydrolase (beta-lactamase superfamily II)
MLFRQLFDNQSCTYTYLIASGKGREAIIIDPVKELLKQYIQLIEELSLKLVIAIDTHIHADHITAIGELSQQIKTCSSAMGEHSKAEYLNIHVKEGETVSLDGMKFKALYTPGHTDDSYSYLMNDRVFTGDTLLIRGTGRTDFQNGDPYKQYDSIFKTPQTITTTHIIPLPYFPFIHS